MQNSLICKNRMGQLWPKCKPFSNWLRSRKTISINVMQLFKEFIYAIVVYARDSSTSRLICKIRVHTTFGLAKTIALNRRGLYKLMRGRIRCLCVGSHRACPRNQSLGASLHGIFNILAIYNTNPAYANGSYAHARSFYRDQTTGCTQPRVIFVALDPWLR